MKTVNQIYNELAKLKLEKERLYTDLEDAVKQLELVEALLEISPQSNGKTVDCKPAIDRYINTLTFIDNEN